VTTWVRLDCCRFQICQGQSPVRVFGVFSAEQDALVEWLRSHQITTVAMQATGIYWLTLGLGQIQSNLTALGSGNQTGTVEIEFFDYGQPISTSANPILFFAREKQRRQMPDGSWSRAYLLVDGSVQTGTADSADFGQWEQQWNLHLSRSRAAPGGPAGPNAQ
jgi:hypothetical protein